MQYMINAMNSSRLLGYLALVNHCGTSIKLFPTCNVCFYHRDFNRLSNEHTEVYAHSRFIGHDSAG